MQRKNKLRPVYKYFFITLFLAAIVMNIVYAAYYTYSEKKIREANQVDALEQTINYFDRYLTEVKDYSDTVIISKMVQNLLIPSNLLKNDYIAYRNCMNYLSEITIANNKIYRIDFFINATSTLLTSNEGVFYNVETHETLSNITAAFKKNKIEWINSSDSYLPGEIRGYREKNVITLLRPVNSIYSGKLGGILMIQILISDLEKLIHPEYEISILHPDGKFIIHPQNSNDVKSSHEVSLTSEYSDFQFNSYFRSGNILTIFGRLFIVSLILMVFFWILLKIIIRISEKKMYYPVNELLIGFSKLEEGKFSYRLDSNRDDLFREIFSHFNQMSSKIYELITEVQTERVRRNEFKYHLLQMQIKPHFIYNLFNNMIWLSAQKEYDLLEELLRATSGYYRTAINQGDQIISLSENIEQLNYYSKIQKLRFKNNFILEIDFPDETRNYKIPNLLLQPLVENSIVHGVKHDSRKPTFIKVSARIEGEKLFLEVWDNGEGIERNKLIDIKNEIQKYDMDGSKYFAIVNVAGRLFNKYHHDVFFDIDSEKGKWTRVIMSIPIKEKSDV